MAKPLDGARPQYEVSALVERLKSIKAHSTDLGNARRLAGLFRIDIRYCPQQKQWLIWNGSRWGWDEIDEIKRYARRTILAMHGQAYDEEDEDKRERMAKWAWQSEFANRIANMVSLARSEYGIPILMTELDANPNLIGVQNGIIDLGTRQWRPAARQDYITKRCPVEFDPGAQCPRFLQFLDQITNGDEQLIRYLQCIFGYCLTGSTKEQCLFILYGPGANGKSVFLRIILTLMGDYARTTPPETLMKRTNSSGPSPDLVRLHGVRLAVAFEPNEGEMMAEEVVKRITGQDTIVCRDLYGKYFEYDPQFKMMLVTNHKPIIRGTDHAIWRRIQLIPFTVIIPDDEQDRDLAEKLIAELPGILNWSLEGLQIYRSEGLKLPDCVVEATKEYRCEMDIIGDWIDECCVEGPALQASMKDVYSSYRAWCKSSGHYPFSKKRFGQRLRDRGITDGRESWGRFYVGLALRDPNQPDILDQTVHGAFGSR